MTVNAQTHVGVASVPKNDRSGKAGYYLRYYLAVARISTLSMLQYRAITFVSMIGWLTEPVVYLIVWQSVAETNGGEIEGISAGGLAAYYVTWTLVRNMTVTATPAIWERRIVRGELTSILMRPIHPLHYDIAYQAGAKGVWFVLWIPIATVLVAIFRPVFSIGALDVLAFIGSVALALLLRTLVLWLLGMTAFWLTRVSAITQTFILAEIFLSGRLLPINLMPDAVATAAKWLPFYSTFGFPIEIIATPKAASEILAGFAVQVGWILLLVVLVRLVWPKAIAKYSAVGT